MIDGQTLAEWMRGAKRPESEIVAAFVAAGRGLAAAHAEGIVHRDFKPHNVLRHRKGRIAVTDFGLARDIETVDALAQTREVQVSGRGTAVSTSTPSSPLSGITVTGSVLGTPAYMAPEQWSGGAVTPATDQFAFCVALWEALAGERPFKAPTIERLRQEVERGPAELDVTKIPRRLRPALLRGLEPDPAKRWPSMDALLAAMVGSEPRRQPLYVVAAAAVFAGIAVLVVIKLAGNGAVVDTPACRAPLRTVEQVWPDGSVAKLRAGGQGPAAELIDSDARAWRAARERGCAVDVSKRDAQLACLDRVLSRLDAVARGVEGVVGKRHVDPGSWLVDPGVCAMDPPPRLAPTTAKMRSALAALLVAEATPGRPSSTQIAQVIEAAQGDPCASVYARYLALTADPGDTRERLVSEAMEEGERCGDERVRTELALINAELALQSASLNTSITSKVKLAELAAQRVMQEDVLGALDGLRSEVAHRADQLDEAIARAESAIEHFAKRGRIAFEVHAGLRLLAIKQARATAQDLAGMDDAYAAIKSRVLERLGADHEVMRAVEKNAADWQFRSGDVATATKRLEASYRPEPNDPARRVAGKVVDAKGAPVAGAQVAAGQRFGGNAYSATIVVQDTARFATTKPDGTFDIPDAPEVGAVIAYKDGLRSTPSSFGDSVLLTLAPTSTIRGRVDLHGEPHQTVTVVALDPDAPDVRYAWPAPVAADGTFELGGVPRKRLRVFTVVNRTMARQAGAIAVKVTGPRIEGVELEVKKSTRVVHVIVRSTVGMPVGNAS
ncbi:MAG TPA: protein kinase, partial [Kofleriaceae bacterium]|nr:protein kinase [Kofleriaceae bacterium]